jgi:uncharacterized small protein (DUF1192 family)
MDWDEPKVKTSKSFSVGEDLAKLSVVELDERIALLRAEILRIEQTIVAKRRTTAEAAALFGEN